MGTVQEKGGGPYKYNLSYFYGKYFLTSRCGPPSKFLQENDTLTGVFFRWGREEGGTVN